MKPQILVARNLRRLRVARKISQEALAVDANIDRTYVSRLERELENPTVKVLAQLAKALTCDIRDFFDRKAGRTLVSPLPGGRRKKT